MAGTPTSAATLLARLQADATLASLLPGGLYDRDLKRTGPGATPNAYAPSPPYQPRPAAVVVDDGDDDDLGGVAGGLRGYVSLWCYGPPTANGMAAVADALDRARWLLVGWRFATGNGCGAAVEQAGQRLGLRDDPVDDARMVDRLRFVVSSYWPVPG